MKISGQTAQKIVGIGGAICGGIGLLCNLLSGKATEAAIEDAVDKKLAERDQANEEKD